MLYSLYYNRRKKYIYLYKHIYLSLYKMFKEKTSKKRLHNLDNKDLSTLDAMHNKIINNYTSKQEEQKLNQININELCEIQKIINNEIQIYNINNIKNEEFYNILWNSNISITEDLIKLKNNINDINEFDEIEYYEKTSHILFNYYDMLEKQSQNNNINNNIKFRNKTILDSFNIDNNNDNKNQSNDNINIDNNKSSLVDDYLAITNKQYIRKINQDNNEICKKCGTSLTCLQYDAIIICESCGYQELLLVEQNRPILKQNNKDTSHFSYKRINHFREWCNQVQGKESTDIPDEVFEKILNEIKKEKIQNTKIITYNKMREILKRLRINKYYEHINYIINRINGIPIPQFSSELEEKLCNMFRDIQGPFLKHCPKDRKNFLSYSYVLYKFFQILGLNEYLKFFPLLKSREKLYVQDQIWKKICEELDYKIIPSL